jgi:hypothetical protein
MPKIREDIGTPNGKLGGLMALAVFPDHVMRDARLFGLVGLRECNGRRDSKAGNDKAGCDTTDHG